MLYLIRFDFYEGVCWIGVGLGFPDMIGNVVSQ